MNKSVGILQYFTHTSGFKKNFSEESSLLNFLRNVYIFTMLDKLHYFVA